MTNIRLINDHAFAMTRQVLDAIRLPPSIDETLAFNMLYALHQKGLEQFDAAREQMDRRLRPVEGGPCQSHS